MIVVYYVIFFLSAFQTINILKKEFLLLLQIEIIVHTSIVPYLIKALLFFLKKKKKTKTKKKSISMSVLKKITPILFLGLVTRKSLLTATCTSSSKSYWLQSRMASTSTPYTPGSTSICYVTTPNEESAKKLGRDVITNKLAACVNIIPNIQSIYEWEGRINEDMEYLMMIKTTTENVDELSKYVRENHPYSVAEVISVKIENGNPPYLDWLTKSVKKPNTNN